MELGVGLPTCGSVASPEAIGRIAEQAERIGLATVWTFERLLRPIEPIPLGGPGGPVMMPPEMWATIYDPLETLGYVAGRTSRIRLGACVLDTLFHSPVVLARRLATLDRLSGGRLLVGASAPSAVERAARMGVGLAVVMFSFELLRDAVALFRGAARAAGHDPDALPVVVQVNGPVTTQPMDERAPLTGSVEQVAEDLAQLRSPGVDQVFWSILEIDPDQQLHGIELLAREAR